MQNKEWKKAVEEITKPFMDKLEEIRCGLIDIENEIIKLKDKGD